MAFDWYAAKAFSNLAKHRISFEQARVVFHDPLAVRLPDKRFDYGETRWAIIGRCDDTVLSVVFTERHDNIRLISARVAGQREARLLPWTRIGLTGALQTR